MIMALVLEDEIILTTQLGKHSVQLLLGDIVQLPVEDKVDIVCTSAFPSDYGSGNPRTLIHALKKHLGINVQALARQKDLDLRKNFSCWLSGRLPDDVPFRRLVCFEINRMGNSLAHQISMVFRAMMPIFNGVESSVITPILATGCQGVPLDKMLKAMTDTACQWIMAGLPLKCLKLVLFSQDLEESRKLKYKTAIELFREVKKKYHAKKTEDPGIKYDVCYCYHSSDAHWVDRISKVLRSLQADLKIHSAIFKMHENDSWQDGIFKVMSRSARIIVVLTPAFLSNVSCLEQFNMGMCCNRLRGDQVIIPFYLETVESFPSYLNLVQYVECRVRKDGETMEKKLMAACSDLLAHIEASASENKPVELTGTQTKTKKIFDIFISYSHRDTELGRALMDSLEAEHPELNVFFDKADLKSGNIWQQTLYESADSTLCMVTLISDSYIKSTVCQEEFNIAIGRLLAKDDILVIPVRLPRLATLPVYYKTNQLVYVGNKEEMKNFAEKLAAVVTEWKKRKHNKEDLKINLVKNILHRDRQQRFTENYLFDTDKQLKKKDAQGNYTDLKGTVIFSYVHDGLKLAAILSEIMKLVAPKVKMTLLSITQSEARKVVDAADMVVIFVSEEYIQSQRHLEELHITLCKQRAIKDNTVAYLIETDHTSKWPFYPHILPYSLCMSDNIWCRLGKKTTTNTFRFSVHTDGMQGTYMCSSAEFLALTKAKFDILDLLTAKGQGSTLPTNIINALKIKTDLAQTSAESLSLSEMTVPLCQMSLATYTRNKYTQEMEEKEDDLNDTARGDADNAKDVDASTIENEETAVKKMLHNTKNGPQQGKSTNEELKELFRSGKPKLKPIRQYSIDDMEDVVNKEGPIPDTVPEHSTATVATEPPTTQSSQEHSSRHEERTVKDSDSQTKSKNNSLAIRGDSDNQEARLTSSDDKVTMNKQSTHIKDSPKPDLEPDTNPSVMAAPPPIQSSSNEHSNSLKETDLQTQSKGKSNYIYLPATGDNDNQEGSHRRENNSREGANLDSASSVDNVTKIPKEQNIQKKTTQVCVIV